MEMAHGNGPCALGSLPACLSFEHSYGVGLLLHVWEREPWKLPLVLLSCLWDRAVFRIHILRDCQWDVHLWVCVCARVCVSTCVSSRVSLRASLWRWCACACVCFPLVLKLQISWHIFLYRGEAHCCFQYQNSISGVKASQIIPYFHLKPHVCPWRAAAPRQNCLSAKAAACCQQSLSWDLWMCAMIAINPLSTSSW